jgi:hypothetical protein
MNYRKDAKSFTTRIGHTHGDWLERVTGVNHVGRNGVIDLLNEDFAVEVKSQLVQYSSTWACNANTIEMYKSRYVRKDMSWAFVRYDLSKSVQSLKINKDLEPFVTSREVWFMPFDWIYQFPISFPEHSGPFRYANEKGFPEKLVSVTLSDKDILHFHPDCSNLLKKVVSEQD